MCSSFGQDIYKESREIDKMVFSFTRNLLPYVSHKDSLIIAHILDKNTYSEVEKFLLDSLVGFDNPDSLIVYFYGETDYMSLNFFSFRGKKVFCKYGRLEDTIITLSATYKEKIKHNTTYFPLKRERYCEHREGELIPLRCFDFSIYVRKINGNKGLYITHIIVRSPN